MDYSINEQAALSYSLSSTCSVRVCMAYGRREGMYTRQHTQIHTSTKTQELEKEHDLPNRCLRQRAQIQTGALIKALKRATLH